MTLNLVPALKAKYPGSRIDYFCHPWIGAQLGPLMTMAGVSAWRSFEALPALRPEYAKVFNLVGYPVGRGYPEQPMGRHLIQYFAEEMGLDSTGLPALQLSLPPLAEMERPYATLHATAMWSAYKNWPLDRWEAVLRGCPDIPVYQLGAARDPRVRGARHDYMGAPIMAAIALMAYARMHLGVDSFTNHISHYRWNGRPVPAVILWGSSQYSATGYPHNVNLSLGLPCQPCFRQAPALGGSPPGPCINPPGQVYEVPRHACMEGIEVERVLREVRRLWTGRTPW